MSEIINTNATEDKTMNEIKTLDEIADMVNAGNDITLLSSVWIDGAQYLVMQDNTAYTHYSVLV